MNDIIFRILIAEDEQQFARLFEDALAVEGFLPKVINSLQNMETEQTEFIPDVIIVNAFGLGVRKFEAAEKLHELYPTCPFVVISPLPSVDDCIRSYMLGARHFIHKSVDVYTLVEAVCGITHKLSVFQST